MPANNITIKSHKGLYTVKFLSGLADVSNFLQDVNCHYIVDSNIATLYESSLKNVLNDAILIEAREESKSIERIIPVFNALIQRGVRRDHKLIAIGGGIIQDITCFISSVYLRGVSWTYIPTTLLSQADSCIGSKSSINVGGAKNILGTFNPPSEVLVCTEFLNTLSKREIRSGVGEILKVHAIHSKDTFADLARDYESLLVDMRILQKYICRSLEIKKSYIEIDEFDKFERNIFNYGHSFGHAIESVTHFEIPHGIAVSIGMDIANFIAYRYQFINHQDYDFMHNTLKKNFSGYASVRVNIDEYIEALKKDKKNLDKKLVLILPFDNDLKIKKWETEIDQFFKDQLLDYLINEGFVIS